MPLPVEELHPYNKIAMDRGWNKEAKQMYLYVHEEMIDNDVIKTARLTPQDGDPVGYVTIVDMLISYWNRVQFDTALLEGVVTEWKAKAATAAQGRAVGDEAVPVITTYEQGATHKR
jgi:hypothetical protein